MLEVLAAPDLLALLDASEGHARCSPPPVPGEAEPLGARARPQPGQGPGGRQARARDRRRRRPQSADERAAGRGQVAARRLPAGHPAAARAVRSARSVDGRVGRRRAERRADDPRRRPFRAPHHSASMPALVGGGLQGAAGRDQPRASRRAVPRRAARIPARGARFAAPAARDRQASASPAPTPTSPSRRGSSWSRR